MTQANAHVNLTFELALALPDTLASLDQVALNKALTELLGPMVLQGLPTISSKQLARSGITVVEHRHRVEAELRARDDFDMSELAAAAPHLTDEESARLVSSLREALPEDRGQRIKLLRRKALALVNEFRLVPCVVTASTVSGASQQLNATLNLTNGSVMVEPEHRHHRTPAGREASLEVPLAGVTLAAQCAGHTISGPVIEVAMSEISSQRAPLVAAWQGVPATS